MTTIQPGQAVALLVAMPEDNAQAVATFIAGLLGRELQLIGTRGGGETTWFASADGTAAPLAVQRKGTIGTFAAELQACAKLFGAPAVAWGCLLQNRGAAPYSLSPTKWRNKAVLLAVGKPQGLNWDYKPATIEAAKQELGDQAAAASWVATPEPVKGAIEPLASAGTAAFDAVATVPAIVAGAAKQLKEATTSSPWPWIIGAGVIAIGLGWFFLGGKRGQQ